MSSASSSTTRVDAPIAAVEDKWKLLPEFLRSRGLVRQHIDSYNYFVQVEIKKILQANSEVKSDVDPNFFVRYTDIRVGMPSAEYGMETCDKITPHRCRLSNMTYSAPINVDLKYTRDRKINYVKNVKIGRIPVMLHSCKYVGLCVGMGGRGRSV
jgi:DNA-directed RNA polymerase III subunit RPC2